MKYKKADNILPENLLIEIQKYIHGELIYIPQIKGNRKSWGENSGYKEYLNTRNNKIRCFFKDGDSIEGLSIKFYLSIESIKKIIYTNK